ncbi:MAG: class B sortase [Firmicutes bacterium]|nr:class B sortase [Bacillota bacterium]
MKKLNKYKVIRIIAGIVFSVSFCCWGYNELLYLDADVTYKDLVNKTVKITESTPETETASDGNAVQTIPDDPLLEIDHEKLMDVNNDYICWLSACGNRISYPVVRGKDNEKYLHHTFFGDKSFVGSIFIDYRCYLEDFHTLIYGHSMHDGSMFRLIADFTDPEMAKKYPYFYIYRGEKDSVMKYARFTTLTARSLLRLWVSRTRSKKPLL